MNSIEREVERWGYGVHAVLFLCADRSMDIINDRSPVYLITKNLDTTKDASGELSTINQMVIRGSEEIGNALNNGEIDGLISISADPAGVNRSIFQSAKHAEIPIVASGASSVAWMRKLGCQVIYATGTTGTSGEFRSINYLTALARYWGDNAKRNAWQNIRETIKGASFSFETWTLPYFLLAVILKGLSSYGMPVVADIFTALLNIAPLVACLAVSLSLLREPRLGMAAAVTTGMVASFFHGGFIGGILAGYITAITFNTVLLLTAGRRMPGSAQGIIVYSATVVSIAFPFSVAGEALGSVTGSLAMLPEWSMKGNHLWIGFLIGVVFWPAMEWGLYHRVLLPFILLEISVKGVSVLGAFDVLCLVVMAVGANITALLLGSNFKPAMMSLVENIVYGTNVEYVYTMCEGRKIVRCGLYFLCGLTGISILQFGLQGVGYLPVFLLPFIVENGQRLVLAMAAVAILSTLYFSVCSLLLRKKGVRS
ncbi:MAG: hypothetical protein JSW26_27115 [Desulfobacterales bacterium]|nr:MAG: hypothetical protein JSW26_27115 [Desulfobacterales bacterium]